NGSDFTHRFSIGASPERRPDRIYHENAGDRPAGSRSYDAEPASVWIACLQPRADGTGELHLIVDSTGLKLRGAGEWLFEKHGTTKRRAWRKLHIGIDAGNGEIVAFDLTDKHVDDAFHVPTLLDQLTQDPASFMADGAYDRAATYDAILARNPSARFIVPPCKGSVAGPTATISPTQRDLHVLAVD